MTSNNESSGQTPIATTSTTATKESQFGERDSGTQITSKTTLTSYSDVEEHVKIVPDVPVAPSLWQASAPLPHEQLGVVLSRSYLLDVYNWTSSALLVRLFDLDLITTLCAIPQIAEKLAYYRYFRCKGVRVTVRPTATPWHYGSLCLSYTRNNSDAFSATTYAGYQPMNNNAVLLDASSSKAVDIDIPWVYPDQWILTDSIPTDIIKFSAMVCSVLSMIGTSLLDAKLSVFASFIDPECAHPMANSVATTFRKGRPESRQLNNSEANNKSADSLQTGKSASGLTSVFNAVAGLEELASNLTGLSALVLDKPTSVAAATRFVNARNVDLVGIEGLDNSVKLAARPGANVGTPQGSIGDDTFSPDLYSVIRTPGFVGRFSFTDSTSEGSKLFTLPLRPGAMTMADTASTITDYTPSYLAWFAALFSGWRGALKVLVHFVGCAYMSARVRVVWVPPDVTIPTTIADNESGDWISEVIEVTGSMDYTVTVPFLSPSLYKASRGSLITTFFAKESTPASYSTLGSLVFYLCNPMVTITSTLTPTINGLIYVAAAEDFKFSSLGNALRNDTDWTHNVKFSASSAPEPREKKARPESSPNAIFSQTFHPLVEYTPAVESGMATAESYSDLPSLCKRYNVVELTPESSNSNDYSTYAQWKRNFLDPNDTGASMFAWLTACHLNFRGGMRFKFMWPATAAATTPPKAVGSYLDPEGEGTYDYVRSWPYFTPGYQADESSLEIEIPWNTTAPYTTRAGIGLTDPLETLKPLIILPVTNASTSSQVGVYAFAAADDFGMSVLQSPPLVSVNTTTALENLRRPADRKPKPTGLKSLNHVLAPMSPTRTASSLAHSIVPSHEDH